MAKEILGFAAEVAPKEVAKWKIPEVIQKSPEFKQIAVNLASNPKLSKQETLDFLNRCEYLPEATKLKEIVEENAL